MKNLLENIAFVFIAIFSIVFIIVSLVAALIIGGSKESYMYIFHNEKYKAMREKIARERCYNYTREDSLFY
jgi:hypothetical protein